MRNLARKLENEPVSQEVGTVTDVEGPVLAVRTPAGGVAARRATSCLVAPESGDRVLLVRCGDGWFVLAILSRGEEAPSAAIDLDGDLTVRLRSGRFVVAAQEGVELVSGQDVSVAAGRVDVRAAEGSAALGRLTFLGTIVQAEIERLKLIAGHFDAVVERLAQRVTRSYRAVAETDQVRAERIDYVAKKTASLHAENALLTAEELVKIDGAQIHVG